MSDFFTKFIFSDESDDLILNHPNAFKVLYFIVKRARRVDTINDGLEPGDAILGDWEKMGLTRKEYRNALKYLKSLGIIETVYSVSTKNSLKVKKRATKRATTSEIVNLCDSSIWDINIKQKGHERGHLRATSGPQTKKEKSEIEQEQTIYLSNKQEVVHISEPKVESLMSLKEKDCFFVKSTKNVPHKVSRTKVHEEASKLGFFPEEINKAIQKACDSEKNIGNPIKYILGILNNKQEKKNEVKQSKPGDGRTGREGWEGLFEGTSKILPK